MFLSNKHVLIIAFYFFERRENIWILKNTAEEFQELSLEEIEGCIEGMPEIAAVGVNPGETIIGMANEDAVNGEGRIAYDIRFYAVVLRSREKIRLIINVEAQKSWYPGYKIPTRGIFYGARMISAQLGTEFCDSNYDDIKKVYDAFFRVVGIFPRHTGLSSAKNINGYE